MNSSIQKRIPPNTKSAIRPGETATKGSFKEAIEGVSWGGQIGGFGGENFRFSVASCLTPWKIDIEPTNHPFRKENDLPNLHDYVPC